VATVVAKLFHISMPHRAYFGLKDYQQVRVIETMIRDLNFDTTLVRCPIVREPDGLAMSSRNNYLSPAERQAATVLRGALVTAGAWIREGERDGRRITERLRQTIEAEPLARIDYVAAVDPEWLQPLCSIQTEALLAVAVRFGRTRLIDNLLVSVG
jgi:pantoate--beta-alanine ligase